MNFLDGPDRFENFSRNLKNLHKIAFPSSPKPWPVQSTSSRNTKGKSVAESNLINFSREHEKPNRMLQQPEPIN